MKKRINLLILITLLCMAALTGCATGNTSSVVATSSIAATSTTVVPNTATKPSPAVSVSASSATPSSAQATAGLDKVFTTQELVKYDGKNGNPSYIAVNGVVYDVSKVPQWKNGDHNAHRAGRDLTGELSKIPHSLSVLKSVPVVGKYSG